MNIKYIEKKKLSEHLTVAIEEAQFQLVYQPKINLLSGKMIGIEALIRWNHPEKGVISPMDFIPLAEESGLILPIGEWVLREACQQHNKWQKQGLPPFVIAVNLSVRQLYQLNFVEQVEEILTEFKVEPHYLEFEITENIMMDVAHTLPVIKALKNLGVRLSLDDFGTGYSSLSYLKEFPFDEIKIDRSFLSTHGLNIKDESIIKATIAMAQQLGLTVVAEGVETVEQLVFLQQNGCDHAQGYFFSQPLRLEEILLNFDAIEQIIKGKKVRSEQDKQKSLKEAVAYSQKTLRETVRQQQGMIFKFMKYNGVFIHTIADGELLYDLGLTPDMLIGRSLEDVLSATIAKEKTAYYNRAWNGETNVSYESEINGVHYLASLRPVWRNGRVIEVIGSAVNITKRIESEERFQKIAAYTLTGFLIYREEKIVQANPAARAILGKDIVGQSIYDFVLVDDSFMFPKQVNTNETLELEAREMRIQLSDGKIIDLQITLTATSYGGEPAVLVLFSDETKRIQAERTVDDVNFALNESSIVVITNRRGEIIFANDKVTEISQYEKHELLGQDHRILNSGYHPKSFFKDMWRTIGTGNTWRGEVRNRAKDGNYYWVDTTIVPFLNEKKIPYQYISIRTDITERKNMEEALRLSEEKLKHIAFHDALTNIPNRRAFLKELTHRIEIAEANEEKFAVAYIDIDNFKTINDSFGHDIGDQALKDFVEKINTCLKQDIVFARQGGDEFMLLIPIEKEEQEVLELLDRLIETLQSPAPGGRKLLASFGISFYPKDGKTKNQLMKHADQALYRAKNEGKNHYQLYSRITEIK